MMGDIVPVRSVVMSAYDKRGIQDFARGLREYSDEVALFATGGTYRILDEAFRGASFVRRVSDFTGQPELEGGLVKTLDYKLYLGLLADPANESHRGDVARVDARFFDLVVVNLYPFTEAIAETPEDLPRARDFIDIGGPTMLRAAAKSFYRIAAVCDPGDYPVVLEELRRHGGTTPETRFRLAQKVFAHTADYDAAVREHLQRFLDREA